MCAKVAKEEMKEAARFPEADLRKLLEIEQQLVGHICEGRK